MKNYIYRRRSVWKVIVLALRDLDGSAPRKQIRRTMAGNKYDGLDYEGVFYVKVGKNGKKYSPFLLDPNSGMKNLYTIGFIEEPRCGKDVILTDLGRTADLINFLSQEQVDRISAHWKRKDELRYAKKKLREKIGITGDTESEAENTDAQDTAEDDWKIQLPEQIKQFSPTKFESFSKLLIFKMGAPIDETKGVKLSRDHGIDGFDYFRSDKFRTSRVAIQYKRYTNGSVGESEIRDSKGTMDSFNAEYGVLVTTSYLTDSVRVIATQGNRAVTLIDGQELTDLVEHYQLHITPVQTYSLDDYYFEKD